MAWLAGARRGILKLPGVEEDVGLIGIHWKGQFIELVPWTATVNWDVEPWGTWKVLHTHSLQTLHGAGNASTLNCNCCGWPCIYANSNKQNLQLGVRQLPVVTAAGALRLHSTDNGGSAGKRKPVGTGNCCMPTQAMLVKQEKKRGKQQEFIAHKEGFKDPGRVCSHA